MTTSSALESVALESLDDSEAAVVQNAAEALRTAGSKAALPRLWERYQSLATYWSAHSENLWYMPNSKSKDYEWMGAIQTLASAIGAGLGWLPEPDTFKRLADLCPLPNQCEMGMASRWGQPLRIRSENERYSLRQYEFANLRELKRKLEQFPSGTEFQWTAFPEGADSSGRQQIAKFLEERDMRLASAANQ
jgi:hypothetical protein